MKYDNNPQSKLHKYPTELQVIERCNRRGLIYLGRDASHITFIDPETGVEFSQHYNDFMNKIRPALHWTSDLVAHYFEYEAETPYAYIDSYRDVQGEWRAVLYCEAHKQRFTSPLLDTQPCPKCSALPTAYNTDTIHAFKDTPGVLYIVKLKSDTEQFIKIGITKHDVATRKPGRPFYEVVEAYEVHTTLYQAFYMEAHLHAHFKRDSYTPAARFKGSTECFTSALYDTAKKYADHISKDTTLDTKFKGRHGYYT